MVSIWRPSEEWKGEDAYVVGGGPSLRDFDWSLIADKRVIGCNSVGPRLGSHIVDITVFADDVWWTKIGILECPSYGGRVVACTQRPLHGAPPWVLHMQRAPRAMWSREGLVYAGNTGAMAVNLALILGARRVFMLGFDMKLGKATEADYEKVEPELRERAKQLRALEANWHPLRYEGAKAQPYTRFIAEFKRAAPSFKQVFPDREVWNVTDDSDLPAEVFPHVSLAEHFKEVSRASQTP